jgi:deoxyribonuclease-4
MSDKSARVLFGPAGFPAESTGNVERAFQIISEVGLTALEYAAVYGLRTSEDSARQLGRFSEKYGVSMSMHAAYYINLASRSAETRERSKLRLKKALRFAPLMKVRRIVFHVGTYGGLEPEEAHLVIRNAIQEIWDDAGHLGRGALLAPEIAGKLKTYGSVDEIIRLCSETDGTIPTIDWAHLYARNQGSINDRDSFLKLLERFDDNLGSVFRNNMHFHVSGIEFTKAGESRHRPLGREWGPDIFPLVELVHEFGYKPTFISESPDPITGALYAKHLLEGLERSNT